MSDPTAVDIERQWRERAAEAMQQKERWWEALEFRSLLDGAVAEMGDRMGVIEGVVARMRQERDELRDAVGEARGVARDVLASLPDGGGLMRLLAQKYPWLLPEDEDDEKRDGDTQGVESGYPRSGGSVTPLADD